MSICAGIYSQTISAREAAVLLQNNPQENKAPAPVTGLWILKFPSNEMIRLRDKPIRFSSLSPDGRKIAYVSHDSVYIINNDGTDQTFIAYNKDFGNYGHAFQDANGVQWSSAGIFWWENHRIKRYVPETGTITTLPIDLSNIGGATYKNDKWGGGKKRMIFGSRDGLRMWMENAWAGGGAGNQAALLLQWTPDFQSYQEKFHQQHGHGRCMTADGYLFLVSFGHHRNLMVTRQEGTDTTLIYGWKEFEPPYPEPGQEARSISSCINNDSLIVSLALPTDKAPCDAQHRHLYLWNWRTVENYGEFVLPDSTVDDAFVPSTVWDGPLPQANTAPFIQLDRSGLIFSYNGTTTPAPQTVTVTNGGPKTLSEVTVSVQPSSATWLSVKTSGSGNTQTITTTLVPAELSQDISEATVTVSGGGATNEAHYRVEVYKGSALAPPSLIAVIDTGDSLDDAYLTWTDNSHNESGFIIERKSEGAEWTEAGRVGANATSFTDKGLPIGTEYTYRVASYIQNGSNEVTSPYSAEERIRIEGAEYIRILRPAAGDVLKPNTPCTIVWEANRVDQVYIEMSRDDGLSWEIITMEGGIKYGADDWGKWVWTTPDEEIPRVFLKVNEYLDNIYGVSGPFALSSNAPVNAERISPAEEFPGIRYGNGKWMVTAPGESVLMVCIFNPGGRMVQKKRLTGNTAVMVHDTKTAHGMYLITLTNEKTGISTQRYVPAFR